MDIYNSFLWSPLQIDKDVRETLSEFVLLQNGCTERSKIEKAQVEGWGSRREMTTETSGQK